MPVSVDLYINAVKLRAAMAKNKTNLMYTILVFINQFAYGITANMVGATLVDLRHIFRVSLNVVSYLPVAVNTGYLIGSLASYLYKHINRQLALIFFVSLMSLMLSLLPHYASFGCAFSALVLMGIGSGAWDSATSIWLVDMWPVGNSPMLQANQFMWGLGSIGSPILVSPFVYGDANTTGKDNHTLTVEERVKALTYPFAVAGAVQVIVPILFLILYFVNRYEKRNPHVQFKNEQDIDDEIMRIACSNNSSPMRTMDSNNVSSLDSTATGGITSHQTHSQQSQSNSSSSNNYPLRPSLIPHRKAKLLLCGLCLATYGTVEIGHFSFSVALFQALDIHLSATKAAHVMSILSTTYTLGRLASAFISIKLQPDLIIGYHFTIIFGALSFLYFGRNDLWYITLGTAVLGYGFSAMWPAMFAFTERHLRLSDKVCSLYSFLSGVAFLAIPMILGQTFTSWPAMLFLLEACFLTVSLALFIAVKVWISFGARTLEQVDGRMVVSHSHVY